MPIKTPEKRKKALPIFFLIDISGTMKKERIHAVNVAMKDVVEQLKNKLAKENQDIDYNVRVLTFGRYGAMYKYGTKEHGIPLEEYEWTEITDEECDGYTPMGECIDLVSEVFEDGNYQEYLGKRLAAPFVLLISDGEPNGEVDVEEVSKKLHATKVGQKSVCVSIGISVDDNEEAKAVLNVFGKSGFALGDGTRPEDLAQLISLVTVTSIGSASSPKDESKDEMNKKRIVQISDIL